MYIVFVKHNGDNKEYLFDCTRLHHLIKFDDVLVCETSKGEAFAKAVTEPIEVKAKDSSLAALFQNCGAYLPIKQIIGINRQPQLTEQDRERIAKEWLKEKLGDNELPF